MIQFIPAIVALQAARKALASRGMSEEEIDKLYLSITVKLVMWVIVILLGVFLFWVFTDPQFCFRRDILNIVKSLDIS